MRLSIREIRRKIVEKARKTGGYWKRYNELHPIIRVDTVLKKEKPMQNFAKAIEEESKPRSLREPRTLHEKMRAKSWGLP